jgi:hypothetical protein
LLGGSSLPFGDPTVAEIYDHLKQPGVQPYQC